MNSEFHELTNIYNECCNLRWNPYLITKNWMFTVLSSSLLAGLLTFSTMPLSRRFSSELLDQLDRASLSALLNTTEGNGKRPGRQRAKAFDDARGSAIECAACLDASVAKRIVSEDRVRQGKEMLARIVAMLTRLVDRFDTDEFRVREDPSARSFYRPRPNSYCRSIHGRFLGRPNAFWGFNDLIFEYEDEDEFEEEEEDEKKAPAIPT